MNKMTLTEIIEKCLEHSQVDLVLTEDGYDWMPKSNAWSTEHLNILDGEGMRMAWQAEGEPNAEDLAEWVRDNVASWIETAIDTAHRYEHDEDRIAFLERLRDAI